MVIALTMKEGSLISEKGANVAGQTCDNGHRVTSKFRIKTLMENVRALEGTA